ncbi:MAG: ATP-binding cassette domain-containing protein [Anaerolineales bacterium]|nr:ATP-binding cassette domain-containing protein [Anaerolineales bacterium]
MQICVQNLSKTYRVPERQPGMGAALRSLFRPSYRAVEAVRQISFEVGRGEMVGFIGPNGAGKTTTLKVLSGLLYPTGGDVQVAGFTPWERKPTYLRRISMVMGNRSQMIWDIPPLDSFRVLGEIYQVPKAEYQETVDELIDLLDMGELLHKPVRNFSLGERMKCEMVAGLLYRPEILFLDEPTLGLDISMQRRLRRFLAEYNRRNAVTTILTSHYMADVVELCERVILIHHGELIYDGDLDGLAGRLSPFKLIKLTLGGQNGGNGELAFPRGADLIERDGSRVTLRVGREAAAGITAHLLDSLPVVDLSIENPPIEAVIDQIYQEGSV